MKNASFGKRLLAYIIDMLIISFIASFILVFIPTQKVDTQDAAKVMEKYTNGEISVKQYAQEIAGTNHELETSRIPNYLVNLALILAYFVIFQFKNKGQTFGKKLLNIKVVGKDKEEVHVNDYILRSLIINEMAYTILNVIAIFIFKGTTFIYVSGTLSFINMTLIFISAIMVISREDNRGLHDFLGKTKVIELKK